ncbi:AAA family ATPase [Massilia violaceinigra]|uniref:AAA family ATPase n=1 Tax=Massilia violaceinigra TaxID=2045208 RepID=UPI001E2E1C87|nr:AAA family ATPase [Massilia violaceinigra]
MNSIDKITIRGYKSIRSLEKLRLSNLNVLIGANGAGKSNFISFFRMLARLMASELNYYVAKSGGPDARCLLCRPRCTYLPQHAAARKPGSLTFL